MKTLKDLYHAKFWAFDLDNTLYPAKSDLFSQVNVRMREFVGKTLNLEAGEAHKVQKAYFHEFGTTLRGLMTHHHINPQDYLDYVHDIDLYPIQPNPVLADMLNELPGQKYIFTNASKGHAERVMDKLGIADAFSGIYDIVSADYTPKPAPEIYDDFLNTFEIDAQNCVMVEDMARNLKPAHALGMACAFIPTDSSWGQVEAEGEHVHHRVEDLTAWLQDIVTVGKAA